MTKEAILDPDELRRRAFEVLIRELGYANAMRFMLLYERGSGDYTRDRHEFLPKWTVEQWVRESDRLVREREAGNSSE